MDLQATPATVVQNLLKKFSKITIVLIIKSKQIIGMGLSLEKFKLNHSLNQKPYCTKAFNDLQDQLVFFKDNVRLIYESED